MEHFLPAPGTAVQTMSAGLGADVWAKAAAAPRAAARPTPIDTNIIIDLRIGNSSRESIDYFDKII